MKTNDVYSIGGIQKKLLFMILRNFIFDLVTNWKGFNYYLLRRIFRNTLKLDVKFTYGYADSLSLKA